jgi:transcriptional regulator with XRE-family HTH domain
MSMAIYFLSGLFMTGRGRGGGKTPERVVNLLKAAVEKSSQASVAEATGLTRLTVQRYIKGIGEPSNATLEKLSKYFGVPVPWLRMQPRKFGQEEFDCTRDMFYSELKILKDLVELHKLTPDHLKETLEDLISMFNGNVHDSRDQYSSEFSEDEMIDIGKITNEANRIWLETHYRGPNDGD